MDFDAPASTLIPSPPHIRPAVNLTFDLQNLTRSSVGANEYSLSVSSRLLKLFMAYRGNKICLDERTNAADGQSENIYAFADNVWW